MCKIFSLTATEFHTVHMYSKSTQFSTRTISPASGPWSASSPVVSAGGALSHSGVSLLRNEPIEVLLCDHTHILPVLLWEVATICVEVPKKHHILSKNTAIPKSSSSTAPSRCVVTWRGATYISFPHLPHMLQHIIECIKLLSSVGWSGVLRYEGKLLYSWRHRHRKRRLHQ